MKDAHANPIQCPLCEEDMMQGKIAGRSPGVKFQTQGSAFGDLAGENITKGVFTHTAKALRCPSCSAVLVLPLN